MKEQEINNNISIYEAALNIAYNDMAAQARVYKFSMPESPDNWFKRALMATYNKEELVMKNQYIEKTLELTKAMLKVGYTPEEKQEYYTEVCKLDQEVKEMEKQYSPELLQRLKKEASRAVWLQYHA